MRTYGRVWSEFGVPTWVEVTTDANGFNDYVYITTLCQVLQLNLGESPFYGTWGIPQVPSVQQQIAPDYYVNLTQQRFAQYFASLIVAKLPTFQPSYNIQITTQQGVQVGVQIVGNSPPPNANQPPGRLGSFVLGGSTLG